MVDHVVPRIYPHEKRIRAAIGFAKERGWKIAKRTCLTTERGKVYCCPMTALVLQESKPKAQEKLLATGLHIDNLLRRAGRILGVKAAVVQQFTGGFDNDSYEEDVGWPKGFTNEDKWLCIDFDDLGVRLRKELKPRAMKRAS